MTRKPRVSPLPPAQWDDEARAAFAVLDSSATREVGAASNASMALAHHPKLAKAFYTFGRHLLLESSLPDRLRELVTLRVAWHHKSGYEWYHHVRFSLRIGISDAEIEAVKEGPDAKVWNDADRSVLRLTDELNEKSKVSDATWAELTKFLDTRQIMDLVYTVGQYVMMAWAISAFEIQIEPGFDNKDHPLT
jgi:alkylhydroperoxidase family enzyme